MKQLCVYYWRGSKISEIPYEHNKPFFGELTDVVTDILKLGFEVMTRRGQDIVVIYVTQPGEKFSQR